MSEMSPKLQLPLIAPAQAMKHVTHNEALVRLDAITQLSVIDFDATTPPAAPAEGETYAVGSGASGDWAGQDGDIATFANGGWMFITPKDGWRGCEASSGELRVYSGGNWSQVEGSLDNVEGIGINTGYDATNRLSMASDASLFSHDGAGHQVKVNKSSETDTASLLFQTDWTGHAEMGLNGSNNWSLKTSPDGSAWTEALAVDATSGHVTGAAVQTAPDDTTAGRLMRADYGYGPGNLLGVVGQSGGVPTGAVIERGDNVNGHYTRFADGTQICWSENFNTDIANNVGAIYRSDVFTWVFPANFSESPFVTGGGVNNALFLWVTAGQASTLSCKSSAFSYAVRTNRAYSLCAIGRWF